MHVQGVTKEERICCIVEIAGTLDIVMQTVNVLIGFVIKMNACIVYRQEMLRKIHYFLRLAERILSWYVLIFSPTYSFYYNPFNFLFTSYFTMCCSYIRVLITYVIPILLYCSGTKVGGRRNRCEQDKQHYQVDSTTSRC